MTYIRSTLRTSGITRLSDAGEFGLIRIINKILSHKKDTSVVVGIGDDAAVVKPAASKQFVCTTDVLLESVHFDLRYTDFADLGWKALAVNLSDLAAMGAVPRWSLISLVVRDRITVPQIESLYHGIRLCARANGVAVVGGNMAKSKHELSITVVVLGEVEPGRAVQRSGASPGEIIAVTGRPGLSKVGLGVLTERMAARSYSNAIRAHRRPRPRIGTMMQLLEKRIRPKACIDVSDGLLADLDHLCKASGTGALIELGQVPVHPAVARWAKTKRIDPLSFVLNGGEDYELLMTFDPKSFVRAKRLLGRHLTMIGRITKSLGIVGLGQNGKTCGLRPQGYTHF